MKIVLWIIGSLLGIGVLAAASESDTTTPDIAVPNQSINLVNNEITSPRPIPTDDKREIVPEINSSNCDRNYSGCVPIATDVDCMGEVVMVRNTFVGQLRLSEKTSMVWIAIMMV